MVQTLRQIKTRIRSIENVKKLTWAMEMVSTSKLRPVQHRLASLKDYYSKLEAILSNLLSTFENARHPLLEDRPDKKKILLCPITSDTGLCGAYNNNIIHVGDAFLRRSSLDRVILLPVGKKGLSYFTKRGANISKSYTDIFGRYSDNTAVQLTKDFIDIFLSGKADEVFVCYTVFITAARHKTVMEKVLSVGRIDGKKIDYILEPGIDAILEKLVPLYVEVKIKNILLNAFASEHSARVIAMSEATDNAEELLDDLVLVRNKVRQANITKEIIEVISAVDALKG